MTLFHCSIVIWSKAASRCRPALLTTMCSVPNVATARANIATTSASSLTMPEQQLVEIARSLGARARVVIMDEPTASLADREVENLFRVVRDLKASGVGVIYISHRLEELPRVADRVTALRDGSLVGTRPMAEVDRPTLIRMMVGRELASVFPKVEVPIGEVVLDVKGLGCRASGVQGVTFQVREGEMLGPGRPDRLGEDRAGPGPVRPDARRLGDHRPGW